MANVSENLFAALQERVLDPLKSDLTAAELHSGHTKSPPLVDERPFSTSPPSTPSLDSDSDVLVYTHDDLVTSLAKQLQLQTRINTIYDRDLACRTQIIEELSVRITELESASRVHVEDEQVLVQLRTRVRRLERALYASQLVNKSLVDATDAPEGWEGLLMPDGYSLIKTAWYESLVTDSFACGVERESWKARVCALESAVAALQEKESEWRSQVSTSTSNGGGVASAAVSEEERQRLEEAFEAERAMLRTELTELSKSMERVAEENARLLSRLEKQTVEAKRLEAALAAVEDARDAALNAASGDTSELARLQVSLVEANAKVTELETRCTELSTATETARTKLAESKERLEDALVRVVAAEESHVNCDFRANELQGQIATERRTIEELQNASIETDKAHTAWRVELEEKISTLTQESEIKIEELNVKIQLAETRAEETSVELATAREQIAKSEKTHEESVNRTTVLTSELEQTQITVVTYEGKMQVLEGRVSQLEASILEQETSHQEHVRHLETEARAQLKEWVGKLEKANGKTLELETRQAAMKEVADAAKAQAEGDLKALRARWDAAQAQISELHSAKATSEEQYKAAEEELAALQVKIQELEVLKCSQETTITELRGQLENLQASSFSRIAELEAELQSARTRAEDLQKSLNSTQEELGEQHAALLERIPGLESAAARAMVLEGELTERQAELDKSKEQLVEAAQCRDEIEQELAMVKADAEEKLAKAAEEASKLQTEFIEGNSTINTLRVELESATQDAEFRIIEEQSKASMAAQEAEKKLEELRTQFGESVAQLRKELEENSAALEAEKARCEVTEKRVTEAEEAVVSTRLALEAENEALQGRFDEQVKHIDDLQTKHQETSTALSTVSEESLQRQAKVKELEEQLIRLADGPQVADLLAELAEVKSSGASALTIAQNKLGETITQLHAANTSLSATSEESLQRQAKITELEEQLAKIAAGPQVADLLVELEEAKSSGAAALAAAEAKVTQTETLITSTLEEERMTSRQAIEELQLRLVVAEDEMKTLKAAFENKDDLGVEVTTLNATLQDHQLTIDLLSAEKADLSQSVSVLKSQLSGLEAMRTESVTTIKNLESKSTNLQFRIEELEAELQIVKDTAVSAEVVQELERVKRERDDSMHVLQTTEEAFDFLRIERDQLQKKVEELEVEVTTGAGAQGEDDELAALKKKLGDLEEEHRACGEAWTEVEGEDSSQARFGKKFAEIAELKRCLEEAIAKAATVDQLQEHISQLEAKQPKESCSGEGEGSATPEDDLKSRVAELEIRLEESETRRKEVEYALSYRRDYSETSFDGDRTRDSMLSIMSTDTAGSSRLGLGAVDLESDDKRSLTTLDTALTSVMRSPVDPELISSPLSLKTTDSSDYKKRAEQAEKELARLRTILHEEHRKKLESKKSSSSLLSRHGSTSSHSVFSALGATSARVASGIGGLKVPDQPSPTRSRKVSEHRHHDMSNPFSALFSSNKEERERKESTHSRTDSAASGAPSTPSTPAKPTSTRSATTSPIASTSASATQARLNERERRKAEKEQKEKTEKEARKAKERAERETKEKRDRERKEQREKERKEMGPVRFLHQA